MFDKEAIQELAQANAISAAADAVEDAIGDGAVVIGHGIVGLPDTFKVHDLEQHMPNRRRARGTMTTAVIGHFAAYVTTHAEEGATVFVDKAKMQAVAVLNLGTPSLPGHADNRAVLELQQCAPYSALLNLLRLSANTGLSQRDLAEFLEDWDASISCASDDAEMPNKRAVEAIRKVTIDSARKVESTEGNLSAERSAFEKVAASSAGAPLPTSINFTCIPYHGLALRSFAMRLSVRTGDASKPTLALTLRMVKAEQHTEDMAAELASHVAAALADKVPAYVGAYSASRASA